MSEKIIRKGLPLLKSKADVYSGGRLLALDVFRGFAILVVIFGHSLQKVYGISPPHPVLSIILCFQMELFFIIAGYAQSLSTRKPLLKSLGKRANRLLIPYFVWVTLSFIYGLFTGNAHFDCDSVWQYYFVHSFWFLRTMFYASSIYLVCVQIKRLISARVPLFVGYVISFIAAVGLAMLCRYVLGDHELPKYLVWFYVGYGLSLVINLPDETQQKHHSLVGVVCAWLGRESLALYALHWWIFFKFLPIPTCPSTVPVILYATMIFIVWLGASLAIDMVLSKTPLAPFLLGKKQVVQQSKIQIVKL